MDWMTVWTTIESALWLILKITCYMIPLMIFLEFAKHSKWLIKVAQLIHRIISPLGYSEKSVFPFLVGFTFGLTFGSGTIIQSSREGNLTQKDKDRLTTFLNICHAVPEDTMLFMVIGASFISIIIPRFIAAVVMTYLEEKWHNRIIRH